MKMDLFIPVSQSDTPILRNKCAFESASAAYDYSCLKGFPAGSTRQVSVGDHDSYLVLDRQGLPVRVIYVGDSFRVLGTFDDWYVCESGRLFFQRQNGEFYEIPKEQIGKPEIITMMLEKGDEFQFRNFMYAYLRLLHDNGIKAITIETSEFPFDE